MTFYRDIFSKAWNTLLRNKFLWFFGIFVAIAGPSREYDMYFQNMGKVISGKDLLGIFPGWFVAFSEGRFHWAFSLFIVVDLLLFLYFLSLSQGALARAAHDSEQGKKMEFRSAVRNGHKYFPFTLLIFILGKALIYFPLLAFFALLGSRNPQAWYAMSFIIFVPWAIVISFLSLYAINFVVIRNMRVGEALVSAWKLFVHNILITLEMSFFMFILSFLVSAGVVFLALVLIAPFFLLTFPTQFFSDSFANFFQAFSFGSSLIYVLSIFIGSLFGAFQWLAWSYLFFELTEGKKHSKIERYMKGI